MVGQHLELADIVRAHRAEFTAFRGGRISAAERRVLDDVASCRTATSGGHVERCDQCGYLEISFNSCRNRHCPKCQAEARAKWLAERQEELLPVEYYHVTMTIPHELAPVALQNKKVVYDLLFRACAETLQEAAADPKHLGADIGFLSVLHTWGQSLDHHPHIHSIVPGGGISPDGSRWIACSPRFFLSVHVLGAWLRGKFLDHLRRAFNAGELTFHGHLAHLADPANFRSYLAPLHEKKWVVDARAPFGGPEHVLRYLARYTHRVAIANSRLVALKDGNVSFTWKDYAHGCRQRIMTLSAVEFLRRFLLHLLPRGFVRIRHYGFLANRHRVKKLDLCRQLIGTAEAAASTEDHQPAAQRVTSCPKCNKGTMVSILIFGRGEPIWPSPRAPDTS